MGMYDKDENFGEHFIPGDRFVVTGLRYVGEISTRFGKAKKSLVEIVTREEPKKRQMYSMLGEGFAGQAQRAESRDFPHVAEYIERPLDGGNKVKLLSRVDMDPHEYIAGNNGPPLAPPSVDAIASAFAATEEVRAADDPVF